VYLQVWQKMFCLLVSALSNVKLVFSVLKCREIGGEL